MAENLRNKVDPSEDRNYEINLVGPYETDKNGHYDHNENSENDKVFHPGDEQEYLCDAKDCTLSRNPDGSVNYNDIEDKKSRNNNVRN